MTERMRNHWWWRPGWHVGRRMYTWHITFDGQEELHELVAVYQARLVALDGLDLIPREWLHLTTQGLGFVDETPDAVVDAVVEATRTRLSQIAPQTISIGPAVLDPEVVRLQVSPAEKLIPIRQKLREAIIAVRTRNLLMEDDEWSPHVSVAYSHSNDFIEPIAAALKPQPEPVEVQVDRVDLIALGRDEHLYQWDMIASVPLGP